MCCPVCDSDRIIILVHSLRALCAECLWQWSPEIPLSQVLGAAELAEALYTETTRAPEAPRPAEQDRTD